MKRTLVVLVLTLAVMAAPAALAVWGGEVDSAHPQVGAMYFDFLGTGSPVIAGLVCSGSYAGESKDGQSDVFLLAGHCLPPAELGIQPGDLYVSFDSNATSTSIFDPVSSPIQVQAFHQMPGFGRDLGDLRDLGVLLLPKGSVPGSIAPVELPPAGYLDALRDARELQFRTARIVGYGVTPVWGPGGPTTYVFDGKRRAGTSTINGLTRTFLRYNQNPSGIGTGSGLCFGDSGSPQFDLETLRILSVTTGGNGQCNSVNYNYPVDTPQARAFLGQFVSLP